MNHTRRHIREHTLGGVVWCVVFFGWYFLTKNQHPTSGIAAAVTLILVVAFAGVSYLNTLRFVPCLLQRQRPLPFAVALLAALLIGTGSALLAIRAVYTRYGFTPGPLAVHYAIDLVGMIIHVGAAWACVGLWRRTVCRYRGVSR